MSPTKSRLIASLGFIVICIGIVGFFFLHFPELKAKYFLSELNSLQVGKSTFQDAQGVALRIHATQGIACGPNACTWVARISNLNLPERWRRTELTLVVGFEIRDSILVEKGAGLQFGTGTSVSFVHVDEKEHWRSASTEPVSVETQYTSDDPHYRAFVRMTPAASESDRKRYLSLNLHCLSKYGGCKDAAELLPTVEWK